MTTSTLFIDNSSSLSSIIDFINENDEIVLEFETISIYRRFVHDIYLGLGYSFEERRNIINGLDLGMATFIIDNGSLFSICHNEFGRYHRLFINRR